MTQRQVISVVVGAVVILAALLWQTAKEARIGGAADMKACLETGDEPFINLRTPRFSEETVQACYQSVVAGTRFAGN
jgi:hypothetical protein